jgi:molybdopterin/thiamine biosynthesis adenylyltransferase
MRLLFERPERMGREHRELAQLAEQESWLVHSDWTLTAATDVAVNVGIAVGDKVFDLVLVYPSLFPDIPAIVRPQKETRLSFHQYGAGGALCLEYGPDNWTSDVTGAMLLRSAYKLLASEGHTAIAAPVSTRHALTSGQELRGAYMRFLFLDDSQALLNELEPGKSFAIAARAQYGGIYGVMQVCAVIDGVESPVQALGLVDWDADRKGLAVKLAAPVAIPEQPNLEQLRDALTAAEAWPLEDSENSQLLIVQAPEGKPRLFNVRTSGEVSCYEYAFFQPEQAGEQRIPPELQGFESKCVGIVGMGSVGSKVAVSLARAGVGRFVVVDEDILAPHNLVRHALDLRDVGLHKAYGARKALKCINPKLEVQVSTLRLAGQESAEGTSALLDKLGGCDVIVDATANPDVLAILSVVGQRRQRPVVMGEVFGGGYGGLIARSRPGKEAPAQALRQSIQQYMDAQEPPPPTATRNYEAVEGNIVLVASDADVTQLASALAQMVLDLLKAGDTQFPYSGYLLGFRPGWIFQQPFQVRPLTLPTVDGVPPGEQKAETLGDPRFPGPLFADLVKDVLAKHQPDA